MKEAPIYVRTHDMLAWLMPHLEGWPRTQRFFLARQVIETATGFYRLLLHARKVSVAERRRVLLDADVELDMLRSLLRLGQELHYMSLPQYKHVSNILADIGRQLGKWRQSVERQSE